MFLASIYLDGNLPGRGYARIEIQRDRIREVSIAGGERPGAPLLSPGLADIQLNGFAGVDFSDPELEPEAAWSVLPHLWKTGVASFCPTLITNSQDRLLRNLRVLEAARKASRRFAQAVPCYHLEGPYFPPGNARGVHDPALMRPPDWRLFQELQEAAGGNIGIVTLAPEVPGALDFIHRARSAGVIVGLGHTEASPEQIHRAVEAGAELSTHLGNGCPQLIDRHANPLWAQLAADRLSASLICDTFHLPPDLVKVIVRMKGTGRCILITDATHVATLRPGRYSIVGTEIELLPNGKVIRADGACLGGSALAMNRAVPLFMQLSGLGLEEALRAATRNPARLLRREGMCAELAPQQPANVLRAQYHPEALQVEALFLGGDEVYPSSG